MRRIVVIGASAAGSAAVEAVRRLDPSCHLILISDEPVPLYSRCLLSDYLVGHVGRARLAFQRPDWPGRLDVQVIEDRAVEVNPQAGEVCTVSGRWIGYDGLLLATGASGILPPIPGIQTGGIFAPYRLEQVEVALAALEHAQDVVVLGAGKVGIKAAEAAAVRGRRVTLVERAPYPLVGVLDEIGGSLVRRFLERHGVTVRTDATLTEVRSQNGSVIGAVLSTGEQVSCQALLVAVGSQPNAELARQAGAQVAEGVVADQRLRTTLEGVYAAGDVAEVPLLHGAQRAVVANWLNAVQQGRVAGRNLAGQETEYAGAIRTNSLRLWDLPIISVGAVEGKGERSLDEEKGVYRRLVFQDGRLVGVMQVGGDIRDMGILAALIKSGEPLEEPPPPDLTSTGLKPGAGFAHFQRKRARWALAGVAI